MIRLYISLLRLRLAQHANKRAVRSYYAALARLNEQYYRNIPDATEF